MADKMGTARLRQLVVRLQMDLDRWVERDQIEGSVADELGYYAREFAVATDDCEEQILDLAGRNATVLAPRRDFLVSRDLDAEAETQARMDAADEEDEDERPEPPMAQVTDAERDPHLVYRRKGQQRPDWSA
ncbi:hypothetical protein [Kineococcus sp. NPDC059986]|uniref:hypothetical protein n=1 Tax=Kineococcus sp. NPDC059986 TaxID=3155538 RepID=UPI00344DF2D4